MGTSGYYEITDPINNTDATNGVVLLDANKEYLLKEVVYVSDVTLTIPAGTVIRGVQGVKGSTGVTQEPGTLVITRSAQINAVGNPANPIIFTDQFDATPKTSPQAPLNSSDELITGLWGGVIILGNAPTNNDQSASNSLLVSGTDFIEGLVEPSPTDEDPDLRGVYGGNRPHDSSGVMKYVSIRNGGFNLSANNEINGLTMGGVGAGTVLEYIEVIAGQDDGFEWFGGTVNSKYLLSAYNNDDAFDYDQGFSGLGQFWAVVQADNGTDGDKGGEFDGDDFGTETGASTGKVPYGVPVIYNMTVIGTGADGVKSGNGGGQIDYDASAGGSLFNSIIVESGIKSLDINSSSVAQVNAGNLQIRSNIWFRDVENTDDEDKSDHNDGSADLVFTTADKNVFKNPYLGGGSNYKVMGSGSESKKRNEVGGVYLKPLVYSGGPVGADLEPYTIGSFFDAVTYHGAFDPAATPWTAGWTVPAQLGYFAD